jgi:catechol 2,3-dioxygenase-like lactoylglutathione lyase family enzyme
MKWFYSDILQLKLIWDDEGSVAFMIGDHQLSIDYHEEFKSPPNKFSIQPGWEGGTEPRIGWSLEYDKENFNKVVNAILINDITKYNNKPMWKGYWSFPILDPMNNTIEITCTEKIID